MQQIYFNKQMALYAERKKNEEKEKDEMQRKENEKQNQRQQELEKKLLGGGNEDLDDPNLPLEKMRDGPAKFKKMKETMTT